MQNRPEFINQPVPRQPIHQPPRLPTLPRRSPVVTKASLFFYTPAVQFSRLAAMSVPTPGENSSLTPVRHNYYYLSLLCSMYQLSGTANPVRKAIPKGLSQTLAAQPATVFDLLADFVQERSSVVGLSSLFLGRVLK